jgi:hypothetical protein
MLPPSVPTLRIWNGVREADRPTYFQVRCGDAPLEQLAHTARVDNRVQLTMLLRYPQADVGAAGEQRSIWTRFEQLRQRRNITWREETAAAMVDFQGLVTADCTQLQFMVFRIPVVALLMHRLRGRDNRPVTCAATEIACQGIVDFLSRRVVVCAVQRVQGHDTNACCTGCSPPSLPRSPSTVINSLPSSVGRNCMQELTVLSSMPSLLRSISTTTTVHAPQSPSAQPSFVPVMRMSSRTNCSTV